MITISALFLIIWIFPLEAHHIGDSFWMAESRRCNVILSSLMFILCIYVVSGSAVCSAYCSCQRLIVPSWCFSVSLDWVQYCRNYWRRLHTLRLVMSGRERETTRKKASGLGLIEKLMVLVLCQTALPKIRKRKRKEKQKKSLQDQEKKRNRKQKKSLEDQEHLGSNSSIMHNFVLGYHHFSLFTKEKKSHNTLLSHRRCFEMAS